MDKVASFESAFRQIQQATGITEINDLVAKFTEAEDTNFSRFHFLNELNSEVEKAEESLLELRIEIDRYQGNDRGADTQRRKHAKEIEGRVRATEARSEEYDAKWTAASTLIAQLGSAIEELCERIGCNMAFLKVRARTARRERGAAWGLVMRCPLVLAWGTRKGRTALGPSTEVLADCMGGHWHLPSAGCPH
jgi:chromosome segregation ATPase